MPGFLRRIPSIGIGCGRNKRRLLRDCEIGRFSGRVPAGRLTVAAGAVFKALLPGEDLGEKRAAEDVAGFAEVVGEETFRGIEGGAGGGAGAVPAAVVPFVVGGCVEALVGGVGDIGGDELPEVLAAADGVGLEFRAAKRGQQERGEDREDDDDDDDDDDDAGVD